MSESQAPRLLMVGMDAFPPELLERWCADGSLPNLAALRQASAYGYIDSVADLFPGATWPTFASGELPSVHGIYHFMQWDQEKTAYRRPAPDWCDYTPFWHRLGEQGVPTIAFDLPFQYPKPTRGGVIEAHGWGLHDELAPSFSSPQGLLGELNSRARSSLRPDVLGPKSPAILARELKGIVESVGHRGAGGAVRMAPLPCRVRRDPPRRPLLLGRPRHRQSARWHQADRPGDRCHPAASAGAASDRRPARSVLAPRYGREILTSTASASRWRQPWSRARPP